MDVLHDLLRIKIFREEKAERAVARARLTLIEADDALKKARQALKAFESDSLRREKRMYADLCSRLVVLREIEDVRTDIELMKEKAEQLRQQVDNAETKRVEAADRLEEVRAVHQHAVRMREKFDELLRTVIQEQEFEFARQEDLEMEEAAASRFSLSGRSEESRSDLEADQ